MLIHPHDVDTDFDLFCHWQYGSTVVCFARIENNTKLHSQGTFSFALQIVTNGSWIWYDPSSRIRDSFWNNDLPGCRSQGRTNRRAPPTKTAGTSSPQSSSWSKPSRHHSCRLRRISSSRQLLRGNVGHPQNPASHRKPHQRVSLNLCHCLTILCYLGRAFVWKTQMIFSQRFAKKWFVLWGLLLKLSLHVVVLGIKSPTHFPCQILP